MPGRDHADDYNLSNQHWQQVAISLLLLGYGEKITSSSISDVTHNI